MQTLDQSEELRLRNLVGEFAILYYGCSSCPFEAKKVDETPTALITARRGSGETYTVSLSEIEMVIIMKVKDNPPRLGVRMQNLVDQLRATLAAEG